MKCWGVWKTARGLKANDTISVNLKGRGVGRGSGRRSTMMGQTGPLSLNQSNTTVSFTITETDQYYNCVIITETEHNYSCFIHCHWNRPTLQLFHSLSPKQTNTLQQFKCHWNRPTLVLHCHWNRPTVSFTVTETDQHYNIFIITETHQYYNSFNATETDQHYNCFIVTETDQHYNCYIATGLIRLTLGLQLLLS